MLSEIFHLPSNLPLDASHNYLVKISPVNGLEEMHISFAECNEKLRYQLPENDTFTEFSGSTTPHEFGNSNRMYTKKNTFETINTCKRTTASLDSMKKE